jgi:CheY-like chemotaxis protein
MPEMDGFGFLDEYSKFPEDINGTSIFMLTSSDDPNDIERALKYPCEKYFVKPLTKDILSTNLK